MNTYENHIDIVTQLRDRAFALDMSYPVIAQRSQVSLPTIKRFLSGENPNIDLMNLIKIADAVGMIINLQERISVKHMRENQVRTKASIIVEASAASNALEGQAPSAESKEMIYARVAAAAQNKPGRLFWANIISSHKE